MGWARSGRWKIPECFCRLIPGPITSPARSPWVSLQGTSPWARGRCGSRTRTRRHCCASTLSTVTSRYRAARQRPVQPRRRGRRRGRGRVGRGRPGLSRIARISPATGRVESSLAVADAREVAFGDGAVWVASGDLGTLTKIDPSTGTVVATARVGPWICCIAVGGGYVWAANNDGTGSLARRSDSGHDLDPLADREHLLRGWGAMGRERRCGHGHADRPGYRRDQGVPGRPPADRYRHPRPDHRRSVHPAASDLLTHLSGPVLQVRNHDWFVDTDPAVAAVPGSASQFWEQQLQYATCAPLLGYPDAPAPSGWRLVPEVAVAWPAVSRDGRTYTFRIRPGFRFSPPSDQAVTAATFKDTIERALSPALGPDAPAVSVVSDIAGVPAYRAGSSPHITGIRAAGNTLTITLVHRAPDVSGSHCPTSAPVPTGTPVVANGLQDPIPSAGLLPERQLWRHRCGPQEQPQLPWPPPPPARRHRLPRERPRSARL